MSRKHGTGVQIRPADDMVLLEALVANMYCALPTISVASTDDVV